MHPAVHIANPAVWPRGRSGEWTIVLGHGEHPRYRHHDGWLDRPDLIRTRWSEGSTPVACPHDGFALTPDAERALGAEEVRLSERGGSCPTPPPRPAPVPCSISAMQHQCHGAGAIDPAGCASSIGEAPRNSRHSSARVPAAGVTREVPPKELGRSGARLTKNLANVSGDHTALPERIFGSK